MVRYYSATSGGLNQQRIGVILQTLEIIIVKQGIVHLEVSVQNQNSSFSTYFHVPNIKAQASHYKLIDILGKQLLTFGINIKVHTCSISFRCPSLVIFGLFLLPLQTTTLPQTVLSICSLLFSLHLNLSFGFNFRQLFYLNLSPYTNIF